VVLRVYSPIVDHVLGVLLVLVGILELCIRMVEPPVVLGKVAVPSAYSEVVVVGTVMTSESLVLYILLIIFCVNLRFPAWGNCISVGDRYGCRR